MAERALGERRQRRWRYGRAPIKTLARAAAWIDDVGFALLWPVARTELPALWVVGSPSEPWEGSGWGPDAERMWGWKDELPLRGRAWYGPFLRGRKSFLARDLLADLYPRAGEPDDFSDAALPDDARRIAEVILAGGPTSLAVLREAVGLEGKRNNPACTAAVAELGRGLVVTHHGVEEEGPGWPSAVLELTARAFDVPARGSPEARRVRAAERFLASMLEAKPGELARTFGWSTADARAALDAVASVVRAGSIYRAEGARARR